MKFDWTFKCETSFQNLKEMLTSAPVLKIVNPNENCGMYKYISTRHRWHVDSKWTHYFL